MKTPSPHSSGPLKNARIPVLGMAAYSGTGKTTLLRRLIPLLKANGLRVAVIKHSHHDFEIDYPGKDSYELRKAGADCMLIASPHRRALIVEQSTPREPDLDRLLLDLDQDNLDLVLAEGFKSRGLPKIELRRSDRQRPYLFPDDPWVIALASDQKPSHSLPLPWLDINEPEQILSFILERLPRLLAGAEC